MGSIGALKPGSPASLGADGGWRPSAADLHSGLQVETSHQRKACSPGRCFSDCGSVYEFTV